MSEHASQILNTFIRRVRFGFREPKQTMIVLGRRLMLSLLLGALMSFGVAWGLMMMPKFFDPGIHQFSYRSSNTVEGQIAFNTYDYRWYGVSEIQYSTQRHRFVSNATPQIVGNIPVWWAWEPGGQSIEYTLVWSSLVEEFADFQESCGEDAQIKYTVHQAGWPAMCVQSTIAVDMQLKPAGSTTSTQIATQSHGAIIGQPKVISETIPMSRQIILMYHPIWTGLLVNTIFYACLCWVLLSIKRAYRHARRLRRGLCPYCAYDLEFMLRDGCAECGWRKA